MDMATDSAEGPAHANEHSATISHDELPHATLNPPLSSMLEMGLLVRQIPDGE